MNEVEGAMIVEYHNRFRVRTSGAAALLSLTLLASPARATEDGGYSYARTVEGVVTLAAGGAEPEDLELNQPILAGDRVVVAPQSRLEVALADHNLLRIDGDSAVVFQAIAGSPDREDRSTILEIEHGNVQFVVDRDALGRELPRIETGNTTIYLSEAGLYRITADGDWTEITVRRGRAELVAGRQNLAVADDESAVLEGWRDAEPQVRQASREDSLERWGRELDREASSASDDEDVDPSLRYRAASLSRHGNWQSVEGRRVWIPRVAADWRPYNQGRWLPTPLGLTWVSSESWGWVPYHYGTWDYIPGYGWAWYPGRTFGPSWVYWYWTNDYAAWIPTGYYVRYYGGHHGWDSGFRSGVYGWAGGRWDYYNDWSFCRTRYVGGRDQYRNTHRGDRVRHDGDFAVPRGIVTTDTRDITRDRLRRPAEILDTLAARRRHGDADLPDVTPFVARRGELPKEVRNEILVDRETRRRGTEKTLPDDSIDSGRANGRPAIDTTGSSGSPERERRARGRVIDHRTPDAADSTPPRPAPEGGQIDRGREPAPRERAVERRPRPADPTPRYDEPPPAEEIRSRRRSEEPTPPPAERPPIRRVIEGARRNHPPSPPPAPPSDSVERERPRERERSIDTAGRSRRPDPPKVDRPKVDPPPPAEDSGRQARARERAPENPPPKPDRERRRRPPGD